MKQKMRAFWNDRNDNSKNRESGLVTVQCHSKTTVQLQKSKHNTTLFLPPAGFWCTLTPQNGSRPGQKDQGTGYPPLCKSSEETTDLETNLQEAEKVLKPWSFCQWKQWSANENAGMMLKDFVMVRHSREQWISTWDISVSPSLLQALSLSLKTTTLYPSIQCYDLTLTPVLLP